MERQAWFNEKCCMVECSARKVERRVQPIICSEIFDFYECRISDRSFTGVEFKLLSNVRIIISPTDDFMNE